MAKYIPFPENTNNCNYQYVRTKEGPNGFVCFYKDSATCKMDPLEAWRTLGPAKNTDTGKALKAWCIEMHEQYGDEEKEGEGRADQSFASPEEPKPG